MENFVYICILSMVVLLVTCRTDFVCQPGEDCDVEKSENLAAENKFAELFQQMMAKHREISDQDCQLYEDCPPGFECSSKSGKCKSSGPKRTKMINLFVRY